MVTVEQKSVEIWSLTAEGEGVVENGSPEYRLWSAIGEEGAETSALEVNSLGSGSDVNHFSSLAVYAR